MRIFENVPYHLFYQVSFYCFTQQVTLKRRSQPEEIPSLQQGSLTKWKAQYS